LHYLPCWRGRYNPWSLSAPAEIPREQFPRSILTCHEEVGRIRRGCYEETAPVEVKLYGRAAGEVFR